MAPAFSGTVIGHWLGGVMRQGPLDTADGFHVVVDPALPANRRVMLLEPVAGGGVLSIVPDMAARLAVGAGAYIGRARLAAAMQGASLEFNGADDLFYFPVAEHAVLAAEPVPGLVRPLGKDDADAFAAFESSAPAADLDEAFVELDHWLVFGAFAQGRLACVASMYPWSHTRLADLGVITLPAFRGRGLARKTVRALSARALALGYEPQYRCQPDNRASVALARSCGLSLFATWDVVKPDDEG